MHLWPQANIKQICTKGNYIWIASRLTIFSAMCYNLQKTLSISLVSARLSMRWFWVLCAEVPAFIHSIGLVQFSWKLSSHSGCSENPPTHTTAPSHSRPWKLSLSLSHFEGKKILCFRGTVNIDIRISEEVVLHLIFPFYATLFMRLQISKWTMVLFTSTFIWLL